MKIIETKPIGTNFDKTKVVLGTIIEPMDGSAIKDLCEQKNSDALKESNVTDDVLNKLGELGCVESEGFDIFYKTDEGYTRYFSEEAETIRGDGTDGMGIIKNVVSAWEYYAEDEIVECMLENNMWILACNDIEPLKKYNAEYNLGVKEG